MSNRYVGCSAQYGSNYVPQYRSNCVPQCNPICAPQCNPSTNSGFPLIREGVWNFKRINYAIVPLQPEPVRTETNADFNLKFTSQKEGFVIFDNTGNASPLDGIAVWKKDSEKDDLYVAPNRPDNGTLLLTPTEYDAYRRVTKFRGIYLEAGTQPSNPAQTPSAGQITITFVRSN